MGKASAVWIEANRVTLDKLNDMKQYNKLDAVPMSVLMSHELSVSAKLAYMVCYEAGIPVSENVRWTHLNCKEIARYMGTSTSTALTAIKLLSYFGLVKILRTGGGTICSVHDPIVDGNCRIINAERLKNRG